MALQDQGEHYQVINSDMLGGHKLSQHDVVILASTQDATYYENLISEKSKLNSYVKSGGFLIAHVTDDGWPCTTQWSESFLPGEVTKVNQYSEDLTLVDPFHQVVSGLSDDNLDNWNYSSHGYFDLIPADSTVLMGLADDPEGKPTYIEYSSGKGTVLATMQTPEWVWGEGANYAPDPEAAKSLLRNEISYALNPIPEGNLDIPVRGSATPVAITNEDAFFELRFSPTDQYSAFQFVSPIIFRTSDGIDLAQVVPTARYDPMKDLALAITISAATSITGPASPIATFTVDVATELLGIMDKVKRQSAEDANHAKFDISNAPGKEARFLMWVKMPPNKKLKVNDNIRAYYTYQKGDQPTEITVNLLPPVLQRQ